MQPAHTGREMDTEDSDISCFLLKMWIVYAVSSLMCSLVALIHNKHY